jgi:sterol desaturase/sphingolipid hydroxylase (fatty acid hydroxylase superfamily)
LGTAADHHVHHKLFRFNYGHTFMWAEFLLYIFLTLLKSENKLGRIIVRRYWDKLFGTYRDPASVCDFNKDVWNWFRF